MKMNEGVTLDSAKKFETWGIEALGGAAWRKRVLLSAAAVLREENGAAKADAFSHNRLSEARIRKARFWGNRDLHRGKDPAQNGKKGPFLAFFGRFGREKSGPPLGFLGGKRKGRHRRPTL